MHMAMFGGPEGDGRGVDMDICEYVFPTRHATRGVTIHNNKDDKRSACYILRLYSLRMNPRV